MVSPGEIRKAYGGRAPKVLDPFAGGGAIPLEAMRLGCEVTAMDINPVAWFILKCTLEYPRKLADLTLPLPEFALKDRPFMEAFLKEKQFQGEGLRTLMKQFGHGDNRSIQVDALPQDDSDHPRRISPGKCVPGVVGCWQRRARN